MLEFCVLASGSRANCVYVGAGETGVLVDCGLSAKQAALRLEGIDFSPEKISGIVLTHEHDDHSSGARVFSKRFGTPIFANVGTREACRHLCEVPSERIKEFDSGSTFCIGELSFEPFSLVHDACDPVGFRISAGGLTLGILSDLGQVTTLVRERVRDLDALVIEANHDPLMLQDAPYPWSLKQRISSRLGHLSNEAAAELIEDISRSDGARLQVAIAAHISEKSNSPELAVEVLKNGWKRGGQDRMPEFIAAGPKEPTARFKL